MVGLLFVTEFDSKLMFCKKSRDRQQLREFFRPRDLNSIRSTKMIVTLSAIYHFVTSSLGLNYLYLS